MTCHAPLSEQEGCDGLDNDCDGAIDEELVPPSTALTQGVCSGRVLRCEGVEGWRPPVPPLLFETPQELTCDGLDNDCDGEIDEIINHIQDQALDLVGVCRSQRLVCDQGSLRAPNLSERRAQQIDFESTETSCDGLDNDCDGLIDETPEGGWGSCDSDYSGPCLQGALTCSDGQVSCQPLLTPHTESCDGIDNDCDGLVDEQLSSGACSTGQGACLRTGVTRCIEGNFGCDALQGSPEDERCNAVDDDCDGEIDESFTLSSISCSVGVGACARAGEWSCELGALSCSATEGPSSAERCDGVDNDCDGQSDEDFFQLARPCIAGVGECEVRGLWSCSELGDLQCGIGESQPTQERCDGLDNDCDGSSDEHINAELCDGRDNDCDGEIDESITIETCNQVDDDCDGYVDESPCAPCLDDNRCPTLSWYTLSGGDYLMGGEGADQQPIHPVRLESFQLSDEITVGQYDRCVSAGVCSPAGQGGDCNTGKLDRENHPINCISWLQAHTFVYWVGGRLPSESQWEYAARGAGLNAVTPWGGDIVSCEYALLRDDSGYACGLYETLPVRSPQTAAGLSPQGLSDLLGNVSEWVEDDYVSDYQFAPADGSPYCDLDLCDAQGEKVHRGGGWRSVVEEVNNRSRNAALYQLKSADIGFRVVRAGQSPD